MIDSPFDSPSDAIFKVWPWSGAYQEPRPNVRLIDPFYYRPADNFYCKDLPFYWPYWVGGDYDFFETQCESMARLDELRLATMLEV